MSLITAHRILIGSAAAFFLFLAGQRLLTFRDGGGLEVFATAGAALLVAIAFAYYLRTIRSR